MQEYCQYSPIILYLPKFIATKNASRADLGGHFMEIPRGNSATEAVVKDKAKIHEQVSKILEDVPLGERVVEDVLFDPTCFMKLTRGAQSLATRRKH